MLNLARSRAACKLDRLALSKQPDKSEYHEPHHLVADAPCAKSQTSSHPNRLAARLLEARDSAVHGTFGLQKQPPLNQATQAKASNRPMKHDSSGWVNWGFMDGMDGMRAQKGQLKGQVGQWSPDRVAKSDDFRPAKSWTGALKANQAVLSFHY